MTPSNTAPAANNLEAFFMPFTANRQFKKNPRMLARAKGVHYWTPEGRQIIDGTAGLWCVNAAMAARRSRRRSPNSWMRWTTHPRSRWAIRRRSNWPRGMPPAAGRSQSRVLLQLGLRGGRQRTQDRAGLPSCQRPGHPHPFRGPRARLSRCRLWRHLGRRHGEQSQVVRCHAAGRRPSAAHPPAGERLLQGPAGERRPSRRCA